MLYAICRHLLVLIAVAFLLANPINQCLARESPNGPRFFVPLSPPKAAYEITLKYDEALNVYLGTESISFTNNTVSPLSRIAIEWSLVSYGEMEILSAAPLSNQLDAEGNISFIDFNEPLAPGQTFTADLSFQFPAFPFDDDMLVLTDWYPKLWWDRSTLDDYRVSIKPPEGCIVLTSGAGDESGKMYNATDIRSFGVVFARGYEISETDSGPVQIRILVNDANRECAEFLLESAEDCISFYREWLGFYPHETLAIIPGAEQPMGGYPVASAIVAVHGQGHMNEKPESFWRFITAHEVGHQYWMEYVLEAPRNRWLIIGLGVYADRQYMLDRGYGDTHEREIIDRSIDGMRNGADTRMDLSDEEIMDVDFDFNNIVTHGKGFGLVSSLACYLGDARFERACLRCLDSYKNRELDSAAFKAVCEEESGEDLEWFFDQWIRTNRYLCFDASVEDRYEGGGKYVTKIRVDRLGNLDMPVPVDAFFDDGSHQRKFSQRLLKTTMLQFTSDAPLSELKLDANGEIPLLATPLPPGASELINSIRSLRYSGGQGNEALTLYGYADTGTVNDPMLWLKLGMVLYEGGYFDEAYASFVNGLLLNMDNDSLEYVFLTWEGHMLDLLGRRAEAVECYENALASIGPDSVMRHDQYGFAIDEDWIKERLKTPFPLVPAAPR